MGDGPLRAGFERLARRLDLDDCVRVTGRVTPPEVLDLLARSDVYVAPAVLESFGLAALEARGVGLPVVGLLGTGLADFIEDGVDGLLCAGDTDLADRLVELVRRRRPASTHLRAQPHRGARHVVDALAGPARGDLRPRPRAPARGGDGVMTHSGERFTLVSFHAHPDDEALLTGGLLARAAAEGHRVVLVTATAGERGLTGEEDRKRLADVRMAELAASAELLGCARVLGLAYADSGLHPDPDEPAAFANQDPAQCAAVLAEVLREEGADVLTVYDANGGYGHPDHVQVHRVGVLAARLAGTPVVLEATVPGRVFAGVLRCSRSSGTRSAAPPRWAPPRSSRTRVRSPTGCACAATRFGASAPRWPPTGRSDEAVKQRRAMDRFVGLPLPVFWLVFGREWYVEHGRRAPDRLDDVFASVRGSSVRTSR